MTTLPGPLPVTELVSTVAVAQPPPKPDDPGGRGADFGKSSPVGLLVLLVFVVAVAFLAKSMTKHLKRVPASFDPPAADGPEADQAGGEQATGKQTAAAQQTAAPQTAPKSAGASAETPDKRD